MPDTPSQPWTWPAGRALVLYHWSWFDPNIGDVVSGWSQRDATDDADYIHLEAENLRPPRSVWVDPDGRAIVEPHTFTGMVRLPIELRDDRGAPLAWIRALLGS